MEECQTPNLTQVLEFKYEVTPTMVFDTRRLQEAQHLLVNRINVRCFTPTIKNLQSPGLSPINEFTQTPTTDSGIGGDVSAGGLVANVDGGQKSTMSLTINIPTTITTVTTTKEDYFKAPVGKPKNVKQQQQQQEEKLGQEQQQQQQQQPIQQQQYKQQLQQQQMQQQQMQQQKPFNSAHFVSDSPPIFTLNSTVNSESDLSSEMPSPDNSVIFGNFNSNQNNNDNNNNNSSSISINCSGSSSDSSTSANIKKKKWNKNTNHNNNDTNNNDTNNNNTNNSNTTTPTTRIHNTSNLLDRTMNVSTLLHCVGLEQYIEPFEQKNLDLEQFLNLNSEDFPRLGVCTVEHQAIILDLLSELNGAK